MQDHIQANLLQLASLKPGEKLEVKGKKTWTVSLAGRLQGLWRFMYGESVAETVSALQNLFHAVEAVVNELEDTRHLRIDQVKTQFWSDTDRKLFVTSMDDYTTWITRLEESLKGLHVLKEQYPKAQDIQVMHDHISKLVLRMGCLSKKLQTKATALQSTHKYLDEVVAAPTGQVSGEHKSQHQHHPGKSAAIYGT